MNIFYCRNEDIYCPFMEIEFSCFENEDCKKWEEIYNILTKKDPLKNNIENLFEDFMIEKGKK